MQSSEEFLKYLLMGTPEGTRGQISVGFFKAILA